MAFKAGVCLPGPFISYDPTAYSPSRVATGAGGQEERRPLWLERPSVLLRTAPSALEIREASSFGLACSGGTGQSSCGPGLCAGLTEAGPGCPTELTTRAIGLDRTHSCHFETLVTLPLGTSCASAQLSAAPLPGLLGRKRYHRPTYMNHPPPPHPHCPGSVRSLKT